VLLGGSSLTFGSLGAVIHGKTLTFTDAAGAYAFRLLGNYSSDAEFLQLIGATHINGLGATYAFDGIYTRVAAVPEPAVCHDVCRPGAGRRHRPSPHQGLAHIKAARPPGCYLLRVTLRGQPDGICAVKTGRQFSPLRSLLYYSQRIVTAHRCAGWWYAR
jgi:hypothetical protein